MLAKSDPALLVYRGSPYSMSNLTLLAPLFIATVLTTASATFAAQPAIAATANPTGKVNGPRLEWEEKVFDFGTVKPTDVVRHDFIVANKGTETLLISDVQPTCGCTVAGTWDREIAPGKTGKIPVQFDPTNFEGKVTKSITVITNDPTQAHHTLEFHANVWRPIQVQPAYVYLTPIVGEPSTEAKVVRITSNLEQPLTLETPESSNPALKLELKTLKPGKQFELHVRAVGDNNPTGPQDPITIKTSAKEQPVIQIAATVLPQPGVTVGPPQIILPTDKSATGHSRLITIRNNRTEAIELTGASIDAPGATAEIKEVQAGKIFTVNIMFAPDFQMTPGTPLALKVRTSHPKIPVISVPIKQSMGVTTVPVAATELSGKTKP